MRWFIVSSHNLSKAAWGQIQDRAVEGEVLVIQSWELGIFVSPSTLGVDVMRPLSSVNPTDQENERNSTIPLPYKFRPDRYEPLDQPWVTDLYLGE